MKSSTGTDAALRDAAACNLLPRAALEQTFDRLLAAHGPALSRLAGSYTNTPSDRDDLLQEIAIAIWQALPRFRGECSERTFLFRIAHNRAIAHLARTRAQLPGTPEEVEARDPAPDPESGLAQEERAERLRRAVHRLPVVYRQVVTLTLEGLGYGEIAEVLGISESNVGARLTRARQMLREWLENR
ncbi:MAG TPA: sigma-70 family RNA polymerase sigma factor [Bryobacteraceae bacterium]|nr:sigma-70 family RNA polymerase sigma factor [Bryobacteraceae bacterium]